MELVRESIILHQRDPFRNFEETLKDEVKISLLFKQFWWYFLVRAPCVQQLLCNLHQLLFLPTINFRIEYKLATTGICLFFNHIVSLHCSTWFSRSNAGMVLVGAVELGMQTGSSGESSWNWWVRSSLTDGNYWENLMQYSEGLEPQIKRPKKLLWPRLTH